MISFRKVSKNGSKHSYKFLGAFISGIVVIDETTKEIWLEEFKCDLPNMEKETERILYIAKEKIIEYNYAEKCIYATH